MAVSSFCAPVLYVDTACRPEARLPAVSEGRPRGHCSSLVDAASWVPVIVVGLRRQLTRSVSVPILAATGRSTTKSHNLEHDLDLEELGAIAAKNT